MLLAFVIVCFLKLERNFQHSLSQLTSRPAFLSRNYVGSSIPKLEQSCTARRLCFERRRLPTIYLLACTILVCFWWQKNILKCFVGYEMALFLDAYSLSICFYITRLLMLINLNNWFKIFL